MIGSVLIDDIPLVSLDDTGKWVADDPDAAELAAALDITDDPWHGQTGDHHLPFGVASLNRVAARLGGQATLAQPVEPLPEGAVA